MGTTSTAFLAVSETDDKRRQLTLSLTDLDSAPGDPVTIGRAFALLEGVAVVEMSPKAPEVGQVLSVEREGSGIKITVQVTSARTWKKVAAGALSGGRVHIYGEDVGRVMLADRPELQDVILRGGSEDLSQTQVAIDEAYAAIRGARAARGAIGPAPKRH